MGARIGAFVGALLGGAVAIAMRSNLEWLLPLGALIGAAFGALAQRSTP